MSDPRSPQRTLLVLKRPSPEEDQSPEFSYLESFCLAQAREVFARVEQHRAHPDVPLELDASAVDAVLLLGSGRLLLGAASLREMWRGLEDGARLVAPSPLHHFAAAADAAIYTLRGFELVEARILTEAQLPAEPPSSHLPVALCSPAWLQDALDERPLHELLTRREPLGEPDGGDEGARLCRGAYHEFVDYYGQVRDDILPFLPQGISDVLEIGCARGLTGALIQERRGCRVTGVEMHPDAAQEAAGRLHRVVVGDIEHLELDGAFDAIVATELFEHLRYPETFLGRMKELLRPGGRIVLSVPNVGHYSVVEDLLAGRWDYLPIGLLCYTHFRFFTRATLEDWIRRVGFADHRIVAQTTELPERMSALSDRLEIDPESLRTKGFYVVLER